MRLVPVFTLETHNRTNYKCLPKFVQTDNASSSIKTANDRGVIKVNAMIIGPRVVRNVGAFGAHCSQ